MCARGALSWVNLGDGTRRLMHVPLVTLDIDMTALTLVLGLADHHAVQCLLHHEAHRPGAALEAIHKLLLLWKPGWVRMGLNGMVCGVCLHGAGM